jgi:hypothetical protein
MPLTGALDMSTTLRLLGREGSRRFVKPSG